MWFCFELTNPLYDLRICFKSPISCVWKKYYLTDTITSILANMLPWSRMKTHSKRHSVLCIQRPCCAKHGSNGKSKTESFYRILVKWNVIFKVASSFPTLCTNPHSIPSCLSLIATWNKVERYEFSSYTFCWSSRSILTNMYYY